MSPPAVPPANELPPALKPPQFSLRTLLLLVTGCAILFALVNVLPPLVIAALVFLLLSVFGHVAGNAIGTRLRELGGRPAKQRAGSQNDAQEVGEIGPPRCAPRTELSRRQPLGWTAAIVTTAGAVAGAIGGGIWAAWLVANHLSIFAVLTGVLACGALGGFASFLACSFAQVGFSALRQSMAGGGSTEDVAN